jgi:hypothetical protein
MEAQAGVPDGHVSHFTHPALSRRPDDGHVHHRRFIFVHFLFNLVSGRKGLV